MRILLVEDDAMVGRAVQAGLEAQGFAIDWVRDGVSGEEAVLNNDYAAVLLDLGLPRQDGMTLLGKIRRGGYVLPVLIITARDEIPERVLGLDSGADDFLVKPFDLHELGARLRAMVRRSSGRLQAQVMHGDIVVDLSARRVSRAGSDVPLTSREFALLLQLLEHRGRVMSRAQLQEAIYLWGADIGSNTVEVHVHHLRRKLGRALVRTVHGAGYMIDIPVGLQKQSPGGNAPAARKASGRALG
jgi:two-component system response regulator QseB